MRRSRPTGESACPRIAPAPAPLPPTGTSPRGCLRAAAGRGSSPPPACSSSKLALFILSWSAAADELGSDRDERGDPEREREGEDRSVTEHAPAEIAEQSRERGPQDRGDEDERRESSRPAQSHKPRRERGRSAPAGNEAR